MQFSPKDNRLKSKITKSSDREHLGHKIEIRESDRITSLESSKNI